MLAARSSQLIAYKLIMFDFLGPFHPVLVHLPIGILIIVFILILASRKMNSAGMEKAISISLLVGLIAAIFSLLTGFSLSQTGDYDESLVDWHQYMALTLATVTGILYYLRTKNLEKHWQLLLGFVMLVLVVITGHLGGSLTHGSDYLWKGLRSDSSQSGAGPYKNISNVQEAFVYTDIIQPLMQNKCYGCHGPRKQKGKLRLDQPEHILKGGKDGKVVEPMKADESDLINRVKLPREDDDHMPPKEKPQLKESDIAIIHWWIQNGASFDKKVKDIPQDEKIKGILASLENRKAEPVITDLPAETVGKADETAIQKLKERGIVALPLAENTNYLMVNFISTDSVTDKDLALLLPIKKQLLWLRLSGKPLSDEGTKTIAQLENLVRLFLDQTNISDKGLAELKTLSNLKYLNLSGTKITARGLLALKDLKNLKSIYLFQSTVDKSDWAELKKNFPHTIIDSGGYIVPTLITDTQEVKPPKK